MKRIAAFLLALLLGLPSNPRAADAVEGWQGAWGHPPTTHNNLPTTTRPDGSSAARPTYASLPAYKGTTVRQIVRLSAGAHAIRLRFSNEFGTAALDLGAVRVALAAEDGASMPGTDRAVTFSGQTAVRIPPGAPLLSDAIAWELPAFAKLAVSVYYPIETLPPAHTLFALQAWQAQGDQTSNPSLPSPAAARSGTHLSQIDILPIQPGNTLVAFGDSVTEGVASTVGAYRSWPDRLSERLQAQAATRGWSVVNAGMGSNRLLHDTPSTNALSRFDRDVLAVPGVKAVIVMLGINDIQYSHRNPREAVGAEDMIAALRQLVDRAHAARIRIYGATITPFEGSPDYTREGEADRQAVNAFIRSDAFDGVVDFDAVLRDPDRPTRLQTSVESNGHLHPNDAGYRLMGDAIDLSLFEKTASRGR
jgi:lysophospholipase L1-like esterase